MSPADLLLDCVAQVPLLGPPVEHNASRSELFYSFLCYPSVLCIEIIHELRINLDAVEIYFISFGKQVAGKLSTFFNLSWQIYLLGKNIMLFFAAIHVL